MMVMVSMLVAVVMMMTTVTTMTTVITAIYRNDDNNDDCSQTADSIHNEIGVDYSTREANTSGQTRAPIEQLRCSTDTSGKTGLAIRRRRTCARLKTVYCSMDTSGKTGMAIRKGRGNLTAQPPSSASDRKELGDAGTSNFFNIFAGDGAGISLAELADDRFLFRPTLV